MMIDPVQSAKEAGLKYVTDEDRGIRRIRRGKGFSYKDDLRAKVSSRDLERIKLLVIPPAWNDVWICRHPLGHLQATGRDARNRKQYRYHEKWNLLRNESKFLSLLNLGKKIPFIKSRVEEDLRLSGFPRNKILAAIVKVMLITQSRVGNSNYAEENDSYGLTTLQNGHADIHGSEIHLCFRGKSGVEHDLVFNDPKLSKIIKACQNLEGDELFAYQDDDGKTIDITSQHVNDYLKEIAGAGVTTKDLRTWGGTCKAVEILIEKQAPDDLNEAHWKKRHLSIVKETAEHLHNTVTVCRKYYIHPGILEIDRKGDILKLWKKARVGKNYSRIESLLLKILEAS